jgi:predicted RNase H-like nuclease
MFVAGIDGCAPGWVAFRVQLPSRATDLASWLRERPIDLASLAIDIPIGLPDHKRACDIAARKRLGWPRRNSVFSAPCRESLTNENHAEACATNRKVTGRGLSQQAWGIARKIKEVDDAVTQSHRQWVYEVHAEVCFWALAGEHPMIHGKRTRDGVNERVKLLRSEFPNIERHLLNRPPDVGTDDLLDAAAAAWTAIRICKGVRLF